MQSSDEDHFCAKYLETCYEISLRGEWVKVKQSHNIPMEAQGERMYSSYSFTTSVLVGVGGQRQAPAALYPRGMGTAPKV
jgi:hypothetical protein